MVEQEQFPFDPNVHRQPPPVVPIRDGLAAPARPAPPPPTPHPMQSGEAARWLPKEPIQQVTPAYIQTARVVSQIIATRILLLIAVLTASGVWAYTIYDPLQLRIIAAAAFSVLGVLPLIVLYVKKG